MDIEQIKELMRVFEESRLSKFTLKQGTTELHLEKETHSAQLARFSPMEVDSVSAFSSDIPLKGERGGSIRGERSPEAPGVFVTSPMVGTFYASAAPDQPSLVKIGDLVDADTVVCIIEAMKVMNEVKAGVSGTVAEALADNAQPVEFGTKLFRIIPR